MKTRTVTVDGNDGSSLDAELIVCENCNEEKFSIFTLAGHDGHYHLQCLGCGECYCDGECEVPASTH